jgi:long-chain fatty acid transport protein
MKRLGWQSICIFLIAVFVIASGATLVSAAGFAVTEKSVKGLGSAFSGGAAVADDATTVYYNPAGMTRLTGRQLDVGVSAIAFSFEPTDRGSKTVLGQDITGGNGGDGGMTKIIPATFFTQEISENLRVGLGITAPFGLGTEYEANWVGR